ncbi:MAG: PEP-CTERM sorting domain-containing protein [Betaproteobacteria bacterium]|nr:PEP-CTERM sorting domain-containing protein [Betaproteobacteria bacterium]
MYIKSFAAAVVLACASSGAHANLLVNPGFESGLTGWQTTGNVELRTAVSEPDPYEGVNYIFGLNTPSFSVRQDIDVLTSGFSADAVDSGTLEVLFGGWQAGYQTQTDEGQITVSMLDAQLAELGHLSLESFYSNSTWVEQSGVTPLLEGTRYLRYSFVGTRHSGSNTDAYLDAAYLEVRAVPEPETYALMLAGLALTVVAGKRRTKKG